MEQKIKEVRAHCLESTYGRYDLLGEIIPHQLLMSRPRIIMRHLCRLLEIESSQLPYNALTKWLKKYRETHLSKDTNTLISLASTENKAEKDIFDFKPTDPHAKPVPEPSLIKIL